MLTLHVIKTSLLLHRHRLSAVVRRLHNNGPFFPSQVLLYSTARWTKGTAVLSWTSCVKGADVNMHWFKIVHIVSKKCVFLGLLKTHFITTSWLGTLVACLFLSMSPACLYVMSCGLSTSCKFPSCQYASAAMSTNKLCCVYCNWRLKSLWSCSSFKTFWNSTGGELKHLSLTELLLSVFVFIFNKQNQLLVLSVYSLPGSIALQSKQLDRFIVFSIQHPLPCHLYGPALVYCINSYLTYKINTSCHGCLTERRTAKQREEADEESRERWWKDWLYFCCNPSFLSQQTEMRERFFFF